MRRPCDKREREWTCGYVSARDGAGPAWIRSDALRVVPYDEHPPLRAWVGTWTGGQDRVLIRNRSLTWDAAIDWLCGMARQTQRTFGNTEGIVSAVGNHLHFIEGGTDSCTMDLTLLNRYIFASDNQACGGLNARFQGVWKRTEP